MVNAHSQMQGCAGAHLQRGGAPKKCLATASKPLLRGCGRRTSSFAQHPAQHLSRAVPCCAALCPAQVLEEFTQTFHFDGLSFDAGLRIFLESFKLPGAARRRSTASSTVSGHTPFLCVYGGVGGSIYRRLALGRVRTGLLCRPLMSCVAMVMQQERGNTQESMVTPPLSLSVCVPAGFGRAYFKVAPDTFANEDAAYILAYSVIMLNTDRHNNQVCVARSGFRVSGLGFRVADPLAGTRCWVVATCQPCALPTHSSPPFPGPLPVQVNRALCPHTHNKQQQHNKQQHNNTTHSLPSFPRLPVQVKKKMLGGCHLPTLCPAITLFTHSSPPFIGPACAAGEEKDGGGGVLPQPAWRE